jgi:hypothetical protein
VPASFAIAYNLPASNDAFIGHFFGTSGLDFVGQVDELQLFNRALSQSEIQAVYNAGAAGTCKTFTISGVISNGSGATVTLSVNGTTVATATAGPSGAYSFPGLSNGTYTVTPTNAGFTYSPASQTVTINNSNATANFLLTPAISWATPAAITYGTALSSTQLNATASVPGTFVYSPAAGAVLNAGSQALTVTFTPADTAAYATATASVTLLVNQTTPSVSFTGAPVTAGYGSSFAVSASTNSSSPAVITASGACTITGNTVTMTSGTGVCGLEADWAPDTNYLSASATQSTTATRIAPAVTFTGAPASAPYHATFTVAATTNASTTAAIMAKGSCSIAGTTVTITTGTGTCSLSAAWAADNNYLAASATQSTIAASATPTITWATPAAITYGTALGGAQLNATATNNGASVGGSFVYTPPKGTVLTAGTQTLSVIFTPNNTTNFTTASASVTLQVNPATPKITWAKPAAITYGTALDSTQLNASSAVAGTFVYLPPAGTVLSAGSQALSVTFTPTDTTDYTTATATVTLAVNKATPTLTWATPAPITYGTALDSTQLNATASVPGTFVYSPAAGAVPGGGSRTLSVTFTPTDTTDYTKATASVTLQVNAATPTITWATPAAITYGTALGGAQLNATAAYNGASVGGSFVYTPPKGTVLGAGTQTLSAVFTPNNTANYTTASASVTLQVNPATPKITWAKPAAITYGTALDSTQLNASSAVAGTFVYSPPAGTVLGAGSQALSVTFTPTDPTDYATATATVTLTVNQASSKTTITSNTPNPSPVGQAVTVSFGVTGSGVPTGSVTVTASTGESCSGTLSSGTGSCSVTFNTTGPRTLTASYGGDNNFKSSSSAKVSQTVQ